MKISKVRFEIIYDPDVSQHIKAIERKYHSLIQRKIEEQLSYEPDQETRNRKPLVKSSELDADWELRFGSGKSFRVFYRMNRPAMRVYILAIGRKIDNCLHIGKEEFRL